MRDSRPFHSQAPKAQSLPTRADARLQLFAVYGALTLIAAIVFGTLPYRPF